MVGGEVSGDGFGNQCCRYCGVTAVDFGPKTVPVELGLLTGSKDDVVVLFEEVAFHHHQGHFARAEMAGDGLLHGLRQWFEGNGPFVVGPERGRQKQEAQKAAQEGSEDTLHREMDEGLKIEGENLGAAPQGEADSRCDKYSVD